MAVFSIRANDTDMGEYSEDTASEALDAYAMDAGYKDYADVVEHFGDDATAVQIDVGALVAAVEESTGFTVFQDSYGDGVALVNDVSYPTHQALAKSIGKNCWDFKA